MSLTSHVHCPLHEFIVFSLLRLPCNLSGPDPAHITVNIIYPKQPVNRALQYSYAKMVRRTEFRLDSTILQSFPRVVQPVQG